MKKLILTFCMFLVTVVSFSADITNGSDTEDVKAVGTVIDSLVVEPLVDYEDLDMGIMDAEEDQEIYKTSDSRAGDPHPAGVKISGSVNTTTNGAIGAIVNMYVKDGDESGTEDQVTIRNTSGNSIVVSLSYTENNDNNDPISSLLLLQLDEDGEREIIINGEVNTQNTPIPDSTGSYEGTIYVRVNYDDSTPWF